MPLRFFCSPEASERLPPSSTNEKRALFLGPTSHVRLPSDEEIGVGCGASASWDAPGVTENVHRPPSSVESLERFPPYPERLCMTLHPSSFNVSVAFQLSTFLLNYLLFLDLIAPLPDRGFVPSVPPFPLFATVWRLLFLASMTYPYPYQVDPHALPS